jgi:hypothetical protein
MGPFRDQNERARGSLTIGAFKPIAECRMWNAELKALALEPSKP